MLLKRLTVAMRAFWMIFCILALTEMWTIHELYLIQFIWGKQNRNTFPLPLIIGTWRGSINFLFYYEGTKKGIKIRWHRLLIMFMVYQFPLLQLYLKSLHLPLITRQAIISLSLCMWSHRVLRHSVFICASRSLSVQASACRSSVPPHHSVDDKGSGGTLVFVDVENINTVRYPACLWLTLCSLNSQSLRRRGFNLPPLCSQSEAGVREFHIIQVSSSSKHWRLHKCINPANDKGRLNFQFVLLFFLL